MFDLIVVNYQLLRQPGYICKFNIESDDKIQYVPSQLPNESDIDESNYVDFS